VADAKISADETVTPAGGDFVPIVQGGVNKKATIGSINALAEEVVTAHAELTDAHGLGNKADLVGGIVPTNQLPSYVDDVLEYSSLAAFPATGETGKIYIALDNNKTYRWSGSVYVYITSGAVDSVAGKTGIVVLVKGDVGLGNVDNTSDESKPVSTAQQTALDLKAPKASPVFTGNVTGLGASTGTSFNSITGLASVAPVAPAVTPAVGTSTLTARQDHVHPATAPTATAGTNTTQVATTEFVQSAANSQLITTNTTLVASQKYLCDNRLGSIQITLPTAPVVGATVEVVDAYNQFYLNPLKVIGVVSGIANADITTQGVSIKFTYLDSVKGWKAIYQHDDVTDLLESYKMYTARLKSDLSLLSGTGVHTFTRASNQYGTAADGSPLLATSGNPAYNAQTGTGILIEPASTNKCTCHGVPRADAYGSTLSSGAATKGKVYEIVTRTSIDWSTVGTLVSGAANTVGAKYLITGTLTFTADDTGKEAIDYIGTKAYHDGTAFQNPIVGMTLSGATQAVLSIVDDSTAISAAGLSGMVNGGKVYKLDNSLGIAVARLHIAGSVGNLNPHNAGVRYRATGNLLLRDGWTATTWSAASTSATYIQKVSQAAIIPGNTGTVMMLEATVGAVAYFILPQLEEQSVATSPILTAGATATRAATVLSIPTASNIQVAPSRLEFRWTPSFATTVTIGTQCLWSSYTDANNELSILFTGTSLIFRKRVAGTNYDATIAATATAGVTKYIAAKVLADNSTQITVDDVAGTANSNTTAPIIGTTMEIGSLNGASQTVGNIQMVRTFNNAF